MTGYQVLRNGEFRQDVCPGDLLSHVVTQRSACFAGGAWIDAPDVFPAGGMQRVERWDGLTGTAYAFQLSAFR